MALDRQKDRQKIKEKPRDTKKTLLRLWGYLKSFRLPLAAAIFLAMAGNGLALVGPWLAGRAMNAMEGGFRQVVFRQVFGNAALMILFYLLSSIMTYFLSVLMIRIGQGTVVRMRSEVFSRLMELPASYFDRHYAGDIISRISYDMDVIHTSLSTDIVNISASLITVAGSFAMMVYISPVLVLIMLVMIPFSIAYTRFMARKTRPLFARRSAKLGELNGFVEEMVSGWKTIQAYASEEEMIRRFDRRNKEAVEAYYQADYYGSMVGPTVNFINNLSLVFVTAFGTILYLFKRLMIGDISSFVLYSRKFSGPINEMANIISELQSALAAAERVFRVLDEEPESADGVNAFELDHVEGTVDVEAVSFGYTKERQIIKNFNMQAEKGSLTAVVGPTGAGKTTLIHLLMRFYDPDFGHIYVDGHENREMTRSSLRRAYAMVLQDTWLFGGTVYENIAYGREDVTMEEVVECAKAARIHSYILQLPLGYQTVLREDGTNLSKGQKQLLTIARAMLLRAKMLILDEATSNVDTRTEQLIQKAMRRLMAGKTCFVIAHRLSTIQHADLILVMDNGNIVEQGTHEGLMEKKGAYYRMYASQFE